MSDDQHDDPTNPGTLPPPGHTEDTADTTAEAPVTAETVATPTAPVSPVAVEPARRSGVTVPVWAFVTFGAIIVFLLGGLVGYAIGRDHDGGHDRAESEFTGRIPFGQGGSNTGPQFGNGPFGNGSGNGNSKGRNGNGVPSVPSVPSGKGAFLGVAVQNSSNPSGAELIRVVAESPAARAGLRTGDVITAVNGRSVAGAAALTTAIRSHKIGDNVQLTYTRDGASKTVTVTLGDRTPTSTQ